MSDAELNKIEATLKECPCCSYQAVIEPYKARKGYECTIHCNGCLLSLTTITYDTEEEAIDAAVKQWNTRKPMERIVERLEEAGFKFVTHGGNRMVSLEEAIEIVKGGGVDE